LGEWNLGVPSARLIDVEDLPKKESLRLKERERYIEMQSLIDWSGLRTPCMFKCRA
jgi:hypothetical protein